MPKTVFAMLALALGFSSAALAQTLTAEQRDACKGDYDRYCSGTVPGGGRIIACLNQQHDQLSAACKKLLDAQPKK